MLEIGIITESGALAQHYQAKPSKAGVKGTTRKSDAGAGAEKPRRKGKTS